MIDIKHVKSMGCSSDEYKAIFTKPRAERPAKINQLVDLIRDRIKSGRDANLRDYRTYAAVDLAYEVPFNQTTPTIVQSIVSKKLDPAKTLELLKSWGLSEDELFINIEVNGAKLKVPNPPVFFQILVPLVRAYTAIRASKLFNDRNQTPLLPFNPLKNTPENRVKCEIITDLIENIVSDYGYSAVLRSAITQALKYGMALVFPREEWHCVKQEEGGKAGESAKEFTVKEGLRYIIPHPTRCFCDLQYPATTINTDTGVEFGGHWRATRFGDVIDNREYWNKSEITFGSNWWDTASWRNYFTEVYPCQISFPTIGTGSEKREDRAAMYADNDRDSTVFLTEFLIKLTPSDWGLGKYDAKGNLVSSYKYPIWHRFTVANDDTVIWAGPCAYNPMWMMGYDYDEQSARQSSFALECVPWQDHLSNILSQMILTVKQNLANVIYYDTNMVEPSDVDKIKNLGEQKYRTLNFIPFDSLKLNRAGLAPSKAFEVVKFPYTDVNQLSTAMSGALNIMERVLQMSAQEVGAAAQHYQSAKEISVTQNATSNRLAYTGSFVDDGVDAWKLQLYYASQAYADTDILAQIDSSLPNLSDILGKLGFENDFHDEEIAVVKGPRTALRVNGFARKDSQNYRETNKELAQVLYQTVGAITNNPDLFNRVGARNILLLMEEAAQLSGAPRDFKLREDKNATPGGIQAQIQQLIAQAQQETAKFVEEQVAAPAAKAVGEQGQKIAELEAVVKQLEGIYKVAAAQVDKNQAIVAETQQRMQIKQAEFEAEQGRKQQAHDLEMQRKAQAAQTEVAMQAAKQQAQQQLESQRVQGAIGVQLSQAEIDAKVKADAAATEIAIKRETAAAESDLAEKEATQARELKRKQTEAEIEAKKQIAAATAAAAKAAPKPKPAKSGAK